MAGPVAVAAAVVPGISRTATMVLIPDDHPEATCDDCGGSNLNQPWWTSSDRWRLAISRSGGTPAHPARDHILCPQCFVRRWTEATGLEAIWRIEPDPATIRSLGFDEWVAERITRADDP